MIEVKYYCDFCKAEITQEEHAQSHVGIREMVDDVQKECCRSSCANCLTKAKEAIVALVK